MTNDVRMPIALTLFSRRNCPLCDALQYDIEALDAGTGRLQLTTVDISGDADLTERYGFRVPVLLRGEQEMCAGRGRLSDRVRALLGGAD